MAITANIGGPSDSGVDPFKGYLDDTRFFNRALSPAEVAALYAESLAGSLETLNWFRRRGIAFSLAGTYTAAGTLTAPRAVFAGTASFTKPTYTGVGTLTAGHAAFAGAATFVKPTYTGAVAVLAPHAIFAARESAVIATPSVTDCTLDFPHVRGCTLDFAWE